MHMPTKKYSRKKTKTLCLMGQIVIESHSVLEYFFRCALVLIKFENK